MLSSQFLREVHLRELPPEDNYLSGLPVVRHLAAQPLAFTAPVTILVGENGVGKSTLIEAVAVGMGFNAEGGTRNFSFATQETHSALYRYVEFVRGPYRPQDGFFLRAESFYNVASYVDEIGDQSFSAATAVSPCMTSRTARVSSRWCAADSSARDSTLWTSPRPRCPPPHRWNCSRIFSG